MSRKLRDTALAYRAAFSDKELMTEMDTKLAALKPKVSVWTSLPTGARRA